MPRTATEWLFLPRFDGPSVLASLLDTETGGSFAFGFDGASSSRME